MDDIGTIGIEFAGILIPMVSAARLEQQAVAMAELELKLRKVQLRAEEAVTVAQAIAEKHEKCMWQAWLNSTVSMCSRVSTSLMTGCELSK